jgi:alpha-L-fucosidase
MSTKIITGILFLILHSTTLVLSQEQGYIKPEDGLVLKKLDQWQDKKFGLFMHWGPYSQWGVLESWTLCPEDAWPRTGPSSNDYFEYRKAYENLQTTFNPVSFNPEKWVKAAKDAGMGYVVFTTKHHDGFSMFDTKQTDYKITSARTPFSSNPRSNVTKEIFDAFRKDGFMIGAYFSKPDWHSEYYWWPFFPPKDRNVNFDPEKYPERWNKFKNFTYNQIEELMTGYGTIDILWLDGGWVRPVEQDIDMPRIASMARRNQPGLIVVDRTVSGEFENYTTPEQEVPDKPLSYPWETCMTIGNTWSYKPGDQFKSTHQIIDILVRVVSRGGNFLLNIAPDSNGDWDPAAYQRLAEIGEWMKVNGEGIHGSKPVAPYAYNNVYFTQSKDEKSIYAFWTSEGDKLSFPSQIVFPVSVERKIKTIALLGTTQKLVWKYNDGKVQIQIPASVGRNDLKHCAVFKIITG